MYWNRSAAEIAAAWQNEIESKIETGAMATLPAGAPDTMLPSANTLLALQESAIQRNDITTPLLVAGGNSPLWLGLLLPPLPATDGKPAPAPTLIYGGADEATYISMVTLTAAQSIQPFAANVGRGISPLEMGLNLAPHLQPGAATPWELLHLVEASEQPLSTAAASQATDPTGDWIAWGVMLLAFCLVLTALLI